VGVQQRDAAGRQPVSRYGVADQLREPGEALVLATVVRDEQRQRPARPSGA